MIEGETKLFAGGSFTTAGGVNASHIASWDGAQWEPLGAGLFGDVFALSHAQIGGKRKLYAGGQFAVAPGTPGIPGVVVHNLAGWNGGQWESLGVGLNNRVNTIAPLFVAGETKLYAGGFFTTAGSINASRIANWDGLQWEPLNVGVDNIVFALLNENEELYVGGSFTKAGGLTANRIAKWNGSAWVALQGSGVQGMITSFEVLNFTGTPQIIALGSFSAVAGTPSNKIAMWNGAGWQLLAGGVANGNVNALAVFQSSFDLQPSLYAAGSFTNIGGVDANFIAQWNGMAWTPLGSGTNIAINDIAVFDDGTGSALYAACDFFVAGGMLVNRIAKWDGAQWTPLGEMGGGLASGQVNALAVFNGELYVGGAFTQVNDDPISFLARWDGVQWQDVGASGPDGTVADLDVLTVNGIKSLFVRGSFGGVDGMAGSRLASWDGVNWNTLAGGLGPTSFEVNSLVVFDDGTGEDVYAGGAFTSIGGVSANRVARWDGLSWSSLGNFGLNGTVDSLAVFDDGSGPALFAGGDFTEAGGLAARRIAKWNGTNWSVLGIGINSGDNFNGSASVETLAVLGNALYVGGSFDTADGIDSLNIARYSAGVAAMVCPADCDPIGSDGVVDVLDLLALLGQWGVAGQSCDANSDGTVNVLDLLAVLGAWGVCN